MEEKALLRRLAQDDISAYETLVNQYGRYISAIAKRIAGDQLRSEDREEISADVLIKLWENRKRLQIQEGKLKAYLSIMTRNTTLNVLQRRGMLVAIPLAEDCLEETPERVLLAKEEQVLINEVVAALPEPDREIFIRRYFYLEKLNSIADKLQLPIGTIGTKLARGKKKLAQALKERGVSYE